MKNQDLQQKTFRMLMHNSESMYWGEKRACAYLNRIARVLEPVHDAAFKEAYHGDRHQRLQAIMMLMSRQEGWLEFRVDDDE